MNDKNKKLYVVGHKSPDTDTVCSAIAYAELKKRLGVDAVPAVQGRINAETVFVLKKFGVEVPETITDAKGLKLALVDHNEKAQSLSNLSPEDIEEIIDHHKIGDMQTARPILFINIPVGCTATIICGMYAYYNIEIEDKIKGILLSSILSDTLAFKSPTCTEKDKETALLLAKDLGVDIEKLGNELLGAKSDLSGKSAEEVLSIDVKEYDTKKGKIAVAQIESSDITPVVNEKEKYMLKMREIMDSKGYFGFMFVITDVANEGSEILIVSDAPEEFEKALGIRLEHGAVFVPGLLSRKKQIVPHIEKHFT